MEKDFFEETYNDDYTGKRGKPLTEREMQVLKLLSEGCTNGQIAISLSISVYTAKAHVCSIMQKMHVEDRVQAAVKAVRIGLV